MEQSVCGDKEKLSRNGSSLTLESALFGGGRIVAGTNGYEVYYYPSLVLIA